MAKRRPDFFFVPEGMYFQFLDAVNELERLKANGRGSTSSSTVSEMQAGASNSSSEVANLEGGGVLDDLPRKLIQGPADFNYTPFQPSEVTKKEVGEPMNKKKREEQAAERLEGQGGTVVRKDHPLPWYYLGPGPHKAS